MAAITVALVNDYEVVVRGLATMLRGYASEISVVELSANAGVRTAVDVVLYDTFAVGESDRDHVQRLVRDPSIGHVVIYTWNFDARRAQSTLGEGISGYLSKGLPAHSLVKAIQRIHEGERVISPKPRSNGSATSGGDWPGREEGLTEREAEILALITQGLDNAQIAERTGLSPNSVKSYIRNGYRRIGVTNRSNAILWGVRNGFSVDHVRITESTEEP